MLVLPENLLDLAHRKQSCQFSDSHNFRLKNHEIYRTFNKSVFTDLLVSISLLKYQYHMYLLQNSLSKAKINKNLENFACLQSSPESSKLWNCGCWQNSSETAAEDQNNGNAILRTILNSWFRNFRAKVW